MMKKNYFILTALLACLIFNAAKAQIIITGVMYDPAGNDSYAQNGVVHGLTHLGGFEYVQLMATENIDFSVTNYAVIWCRNPGATTTSVANGWVSGGDRTYQFSLTSGTVNKGEFFYVGGPEKTIAGYVYKDPDVNPGVRTTDISSLKWIYTKAYGSLAGDNGIGSSTTAGLANSGNPTGIAVFLTASVTSSTVPVDAIFVGPNPMGSGSKTALLVDGSTGPGYVVPTNDHYNNAQGYAGVGTNTFCFAYQADATIGLTADYGNFLKLGGQYNPDTKTWAVARTASYVQLVPNKTSSASANYGTVAMIEGNAAGYNGVSAEPTTLVTATPVTLVSFSAKKGTSGIYLNWSTASEQNNDYFSVLRSSDGKSFESIGKVNGAGTKNGISTYQFSDYNPLPGVNYYKLRQVDLDSKSSESGVVYASFDLNKFSLSVSIQNGSTALSINTPVKGTAILLLTDIQGRKLKTLTPTLEAGVNLVPLNTNLPAGIYVVSLQLGTQQSSSKFVVN